jgi:hypothetical protein
MGAKAREQKRLEGNKMAEGKSMQAMGFFAYPPVEVYFSNMCGAGR